jgi:hypothetical protein
MPNTNALAVTDLMAILDKVEGENAFIQSVLAEADAQALEIQKKGSNSDTRKAALRTAVAKASKKDLAPVAKALSEYKALAHLVSAIAANKDAVDILDENEATIVMEQVLSGKLLEEFVKATYETAKSLVFTSLDNGFAEAGEEFPEHTNGSIDVPALGKRFVREGAGRKPAILVEADLRDAVGDDVWEEITSEEVIPEQRVRVLDEAKLIAATTANPALLEQVRAAVKAGDWKTPRLMIRDIPANELEQE